MKQYTVFYMSSSNSIYQTLVWMAQTSTSVSFNIQKRASSTSGTLLPGATFKVYEYDWNSSKWTLFATLTNRSSGYYTISGMTSGWWYQVVETAAPSGYQINDSNPRYFKAPSSSSTIPTFYNTPTESSSYVISNGHNYYVVAQLHDDGFYYVSDHTESEAEATHFVPTDDGRIFIRCLEDDEYTITEVKTDNGYTLLRDDIKVVISAAEGELCSIYDEDTLGVVQNDERYTHIQKHLEHRLLTASATVDDNTVDMNPDGNSEHAFAPFKVVNTRGFDLPRTGSAGNWMYPVVGVLVMLISAAIIFFVVRRKKHI